MTPFGLQLYSARNVPTLSAFLTDLAAMGYAHVEGFGGAYSDPQAVRATLDEAGLTMPLGHFGLADLRRDFDGCADVARTLGVKTIIAPYLDATKRPDDRTGYAALARELGALHRRCADAGFGFAWHNHDFEFVPLRDGSTGMDVILSDAPDMAWEADIAWIIRGGADPAAWIGKYGSRMTAVHVKDIAPKGENADQDGWSGLGDGTVDWPALIAAIKAEAGDVLWIAEHDNPRDPHVFAEQAIATFNGWMAG
ncbi:sugar phosphate isomerase/epimerase [uncultured Tateyamaria sp.]|uniref:sugar phosphate isomerase/epimerase family protein n=1 Tax=Tateyamaria sp. 1078 TaxID=3417464 RepID=UPI0026107FCD|nr:sugar phosphate isomerase/epimerase [uncultured Tateyamaria sp.]